MAERKWRILGCRGNSANLLILPHVAARMRGALVVNSNIFKQASFLGISFYFPLCLPEAFSSSHQKAEICNTGNVAKIVKLERLAFL